MAAGDAYLVGPTSTADDAFLDLVPGGGEIVIHNIYVPVGTSVELYWSDGMTDILIDSGSESFATWQFHASDTVYLRVKNVSGTSADLGADGMYTA